MRRIIGAIPLLLFVSVAVFALLHAAPGGPTGAYMRRGNMNAEDLARARGKAGAERSRFPSSTASGWGGCCKATWAWRSPRKRPVAVEILDRLPNTLTLMGVAWVVTLLIAIPVGILSAVRQYSKFDHAGHDADLHRPVDPHLLVRADPAARLLYEAGEPFHRRAAAARRRRADDGRALLAWRPHRST